MSPMKYSIIVPHFNDFKSLERLLDSIPHRDDIEVIVVDDKSTDTYELTNIKSKCIFLDNNTEQKSAGTCRNLGLKIAKGKWLLFADSDDVFTDEAFNYLDAVSQSNDDIIYFKSLSLVEETGEISDRNSYLLDLVNQHLQTGDESIRYRYYPPWGKLIRHQLVKDNNISFDQVMASNDVMFSVKTGYYAKSISSVDKPIYCVMQRKNSLTTKPSKKNQKIRLVVELNKNDFLYEKGLKYYQTSLQSLLSKYKDVLSSETSFRIVRSFISFRQRVLPNSIQDKLGFK